VRFYGQDLCHGRRSCLFSNEAQIPKLDVAGSSPVSRSMFSTACRECEKATMAEDGLASAVLHTDVWRVGGEGGE
jgi:hypothetical protein